MKLRRDAKQHCSRCKFCMWDDTNACTDISCLSLCNPSKHFVLIEPGKSLCSDKRPDKSQGINLAAKKGEGKHTLRYEAKSPQHCRVASLRPTLKFKDLFQLMLLITWALSVQICQLQICSWVSPCTFVLLLLMTQAFIYLKLSHRCLSKSST